MSQLIEAKKPELRGPKCVVRINCPQCHDEKGKVQPYYAELTEIERKDLETDFQRTKRRLPNLKAPDFEYHHRCPLCHGTRKIRLTTYHRIMGDEELQRRVEEFERNAVRKTVRADLAFWQVTRDFNNVEQE